MRRRVLVLALSFIVTLAFGSVGVATAAPWPAWPDLGSLGQGPGTSAGCSADLYSPGDWRLGPKELSTEAPVGPELIGYKRLGNFTDPQDFLTKWWDPNAVPQPSWRYPEQQGYVIRNGKPVKHRATLAVGKSIDRYGGEGGNFFAPTGTRYAKRSLPPSNLVNSASPRYCNYHVYQVVKQLPLYSGPIAPAFEQPGLGTQYEVVQQLLPSNPQCGTTVNVGWLLCAGYLLQTFPPVTAG
ncbi:TNT domain-containing protein [Gordonia aichiensis]